MIFSRATTHVRRSNMRPEAWEDGPCGVVYRETVDMSPEEWEECVERALSDVDVDRAREAVNQSYGRGGLSLGIALVESSDVD